MMSQLRMQNVFFHYITLWSTSYLFIYLEFFIVILLQLFQLFPLCPPPPSPPPAFMSIPTLLSVSMGHSYMLFDWTLPLLSTIRSNDSPQIISLNFYCRVFFYVQKLEYPYKCAGSVDRINSHTIKTRQTNTSKIRGLEK